jgi:RNA recognition motif-containing protein
MGRKLFVGNFPYETGEAELEALFSQAGAIDTVRVMRDMSTGRARGFGFVEMQSDDEAQTAIQKFNGQDMGGRALIVNEARPKPALRRRWRRRSGSPAPVRTALVAPAHVDCCRARRLVRRAFFVRRKE